MDLIEKKKMCKERGGKCEKWELNSQEVRGFVFILMKKLLEVDRISRTNVTFSPQLFFSFTGTEYKKGNRVSLILDLFDTV